MKHDRNYFIDEQGRLVWQVILDGTVRRYFVGNNIQGFIEADERGEYLMVQNEKRYWRGQIVPFPDEFLLLRDFNLFILKPDCAERGLVKEIRSVVADSFEILAEKSVALDREKAFRLYPFFFEADWERNFLEYLTSGLSIFLLVAGADIFRRLSITRNYIRFKYKNEKDRHPVYSLVHCADNREDAIRESLTVFGQDELVAKVGFPK